MSNNWGEATTVRNNIITVAKFWGRFSPYRKSRSLCSDSLPWRRSCWGTFCTCWFNWTYLVYTRRCFCYQKTFVCLSMSWDKCPSNFSLNLTHLDWGPPSRANYPDGSLGCSAPIGLSAPPPARMPPPWSGRSRGSPGLIRGSAWWPRQGLGMGQDLVGLLWGGLGETHGPY